MQSVPLLVLANKQDLINALPAPEVGAGHADVLDCQHKHTVLSTSHINDVYE